jgi:hypothetical protein
VPHIGNQEAASLVKGGVMMALAQGAG